MRERPKLFHSCIPIPLVVVCFAWRSQGWRRMGTTIQMPYPRNKAMSERTPFRMHQRNGFPVVTSRPPFVYGPGNPFLPRGVLLGPPAASAPTTSTWVNGRGPAAGSRPTGAFHCDRILRAGGHPMRPKLYFGQYFDVPAITIVINKAQRMLKLKPIDFATGLKETYRWYVRKRPFPAPDYSFDQRRHDRPADAAGVLDHEVRVYFGDLLGDQAVVDGLGAVTNWSRCC